MKISHTWSSFLPKIENFLENNINKGKWAKIVKLILLQQVILMFKYVKAEKIWNFYFYTFSKYKNKKGGGILRQFWDTQNFITGSQATVFDGIGWFFLLGLFLIGLPLFYGFAAAVDPPQNWKLTIFGHFLFCGGSAATAAANP